MPLYFSVVADFPLPLTVEVGKSKNAQLYYGSISFLPGFAHALLPPGDTPHSLGKTDLEEKKVQECSD